MFLYIFLLLWPVYVNGVLYGKDHLPDKHLVVSFDDGPNNKTTPQLLDTLLQHNIKASFFMVGANIDNSILMHRMIHEGHIVGSHTFGHQDLKKVSKEKMEEEIIHNEKRFQKHMGDRPWFFRAPYGSLNSDAITFLNNRHYQIIGWDDDTFDWEKTSPEQVVTATIDRLKTHETGAIMLMHEIVWTVEAQKTLLPKIKTLGWQFSNPIDILTPEQLDSLITDSCVPDVCKTYFLTRPWCCPCGEQSEGIEGALRKQKREICSSMVDMERRLEKQEKASMVDMERRLEKQQKSSMVDMERRLEKQEKIAFGAGVGLCFVMCCISSLIVMLYNKKKEKKR